MDFHNWINQTKFIKNKVGCQIRESIEVLASILNICTGEKIQDSVQKNEFLDILFGAIIIPKVGA